MNMRPVIAPIIAAFVLAASPGSAAPNWVSARKNLSYGFEAEIDKNSIRTVAGITTFRARWLRYGVPQAEMDGAAMCGAKPPQAHDMEAWFSVYSPKVLNGDAGTHGAEKVCNIVNSR